MNFRFFGDSWFWTWYRSKVDGDKTSNFCRSQAMERIDKYEGGLSLIRILLQEMGHTVNNYARPGTGFRSTRLAYESNGWGTKEVPSINIIFVSSNLRHFHSTEGRDFIQYDVDLSSVDNFIKCYDDLMIKDLKNLMHYNNPNDTYLLVSGQENLPMDVFMAAKNKIKLTHGWELPNWHLLSESILVDLACAYNGTPYPNYKNIQELRDFLMSKTPRFGMCRANEIGVHMDANNVQNIGEDLVSMIEEQNDTFVNFWNDGSIYHTTILMTPDTSHLGFTGQVYFVDFVMKFLEDNDIVY